MNPIQAASGKLIAAYRRNPSHCLYCNAVDLTDEHGVQEAIGGRLTAKNLCVHHNGVVNGADTPLNKNFAPLVQMLQIRRHRGVVGAEFQAVDSGGKTITILAEGFAKQNPLDVTSKDENGKILRAVGDLSKLDGLPDEAFSPGTCRHAIAVITAPEGQFFLGSDENITGGILKIAFHFFTGFVRDVPMRIAERILPYITGEKEAGRMFVRTPFLSDDAFPESWPPRHEVTAYPMGNCTLVTVLLFGAYGYLVKLPFKMSGTTGIRYRQTLSENYPEFYDDVPIPQSLTWDTRRRLDSDAWAAPVQKRMKRIQVEGTQYALRARCKRAYEKAKAESHNFGDIWERYRFALQLEVFSTEDIDEFIRIGKGIFGEGREPWEIPVAWIEDDGSLITALPEKKSA